MSAPFPQNQFLRSCKLVVSTNQGSGLDLSAFRIKFAVKRSDTMTPNSADIRVYNLDLETAADIKKEFTTVFLDAGYISNTGLIFKGNIKQVILGRESATDTFIDIIAGDGDQAYNFSIVNTTLAAGSNAASQLMAASKPMATYGVMPGMMAGVLPENKLPRGKVMYGNARDHIRAIADSAGFGWSMQDQQLNFVQQSTYLPGEIVTITSKTGMIGTPEQTNEGVNIKCLLNPKIKIASRVKIDNASVQLFKINLGVPGSPANTAPAQNADGIYYVLSAEHQGDNRGTDWYTNLVTLNVEVTSNPLNAVQSSSGGYA